MKRVAIVDYGAGNLRSVVNAITKLGWEARLASCREDFVAVAGIILPGVGAFADGMTNLRRSGLVESLNDLVIRDQMPCLGICLGMQLMADRGFEGGETPGLGWFPGEVRRLTPAAAGERIPHVGWNEVRLERPSSLFEKIESGKDFYFVHGYSMTCEREEDVIASTPHCGSFVSAVGRGHIFGVQFHPEKSQRCGLALLDNFLKLVA